MKTVAFLTTTRADFSYLAPLVEAMAGDARFQPHVIVSGTHLSPLHGNTVSDIERAQIPIAARIPLDIPQHGTANQPPALAQLLDALSRHFAHQRPDMLVLLGDRGEALVAAIAATYARIPIVHLHGGENTCGGNFDDTLRHAISKLAHLHCAACEADGQRLRERLGEEAWRVHVTGSPSHERLRRAAQTLRAELAARMSLPDRRPLAILLQHSETSAASESGIQFACSEHIFAGIEALNGERGFSFMPNLGPNDFSALLYHADVMVGNSSAGVYEAPLTALPVVNIGNRQLGRHDRHPNVITVPFDLEQVTHAIRDALAMNRSALPKATWRGSPSRAILELLAELNPTPELFRKTLEEYDGSMKE